MDTTKENENISAEPVLSFEEYVTLECERQWNENQKETYGEWAVQSDDTKAEYYNDMFASLLDQKDVLGGVYE